MKHILLIQITMLLLSGLYGQSNVGIGTNTPNPAALLHIDMGNNISSGILITGEKNANATIPSLGTGSRLMFYPGKAAFRYGFRRA